MKRFWYTILGLTVLLPFSAQNELKKWYFGQYAVLDFMTTPPTPLFNSAMVTSEACASIADAQGNLLFYSNADSIWNKNHLIMDNGGGLLGHRSAVQGALIVQLPGSASQYYLFTLDAQGGANGLRYSVVDMSLNAGTGSVTAKNILLYTPATERMAATTHCNGTDIWIVTHKWNSDEFVAHLLTSAGINSAAVVSPVGTIHTGPPPFYNAAGTIKISPSGKRLAMTVIGDSLTEVYDFNTSSGVVGNRILLDSTSDGPDGIEFSPDGSKLYYTHFPYNNSFLYQFDLCAGSDSAIRASKTLISNSKHFKGLQLGPDGRIYVAKSGDKFLGVINEPNKSGTLCNYVDSALSLAPGMCLNELPNMLLARQPVPFTYTASCQEVQFRNVPATYTIYNNCTQAIPMVTSVNWDFGDTASGPSNVSSLHAPTHFFSNPGTYTVQLVRHQACSDDTLRQVITVSPSPQFTVNGPSKICVNEILTLSVVPGTGYNYSWTPGGAGTSGITTTLSISTLFNVTVTDSVSGCATSMGHLVALDPCSGIGDQASETIKIFPNPSEGEVEVLAPPGSLLCLINALGETVWERQIRDKNSKFDVGDQPRGIYIVLIKQGMTISRVVKLIRW